MNVVKNSVNICVILVDSNEKAVYPNPFFCVSFYKRNLIFTADIHHVKNDNGLVGKRVGLGICLYSGCEFNPWV